VILETTSLKGVLAAICPTVPGQVAGVGLAALCPTVPGQVAGGGVAVLGHAAEIHRFPFQQLYMKTRHSVRKNLKCF
jgi:hypothetical protein